MDTRIWGIELDLLRTKLVTCAPAAVCAAVSEDTDEAAQAAYARRWDGTVLTDNARHLLRLLTEVLEHRDRRSGETRFGLVGMVHLACGSDPANSRALNPRCAARSPGYTEEERLLGM